MSPSENSEKARYNVEDKRGEEDYITTADRFVPSRGTCTSSSQLKLETDENWTPKNDYHEVLSKNLLGQESLTHTKVLSYRHKPKRQEAHQNDYKVLFSSSKETTSKARTALTRVVPQSPMKVLDAPGIVDDFYSHPIDWSLTNVIAVALSEMVFLFDTTTGHTEKLLALPAGNVTTLRWTGEGLHLAVGTSTGDVQLWDCCAERQLRNLRGHGGRIGALAWHQHVLSSGAADAEIHQHDVRIREHLYCRRSGIHDDLVCGLDYNSEGVLASGGNDNSVFIWETPQATEPLHNLTGHNAAVKALRWCPWQRHLLATGGGSADRKVCIWNAASGRLLASQDAESQVTGIVWGMQEKELLTAHGYSRNQLSLWKYPSLTKTADLEGHTGRLLGLAQSPNSSLICSSSADETLRFWQVFTPSEGTSKAANAKQAIAPKSFLKTIR